MNKEAKDSASFQNVDKVYADIVSVILGRGAMSKAEIVATWDLNSDQYDFLKSKLLKERLLEIGPKGVGGFRARFARRAQKAESEESTRFFTTDWELLYRYRGTNPDHPDNVGLRNAMTGRIPLVYFHRIVEGRYLAVWPVFIVGDELSRLTFKVEFDDAQHSAYAPGAFPVLDPVTEIRRSYVTTTVRLRIHQRAFRERVLRAYQEQCALCRLRHEELLDAAHIIPDGEPDGKPVVPNGLSLCKLHHAAFDRQFLAVRPDYVIEVRRDILEETDGPMLLHGLKGMHDQRIILPRNRADRPNADLLARRYEKFLVGLREAFDRA